MFRKIPAASPIVIAFVLSVTAFARAQNAGVPPAAPVPAADAGAAPGHDTPPSAGSPAAGVPPAVGEPTSAAIAPPGAAASPAKVEKAEAVAKEAALTPIVPSPKDATRPAFQLYAEVDLPVLGVGLVFAAARLVRVQKPFCAPLCDPNDLNALDRVTAGFWSPQWSTVSDIGLYGLMAGAAVVLVANEGPLDALNDAVVVAESALSATALASVGSLAAGRPRPFVYGTAAPESSRDSGDAGLSFLSSHTAVSFAVVMSTFVATKRLNGSKSVVPYLVLGLGGAVASVVGLARVESGNHFITDAVGGAVVGASLGVLIPSLHSSPVKIVPVVSQTERGLGLPGAF
jgi:membrane-associated phospholipid phosphatase